MKPIGILYIAVGIIAVIGAIAAGYFAIIVGTAFGAIQSADASQLPPDTDVAALQQSTASLGTLLAVGWVFIICWLISGAVSMRHGLKVLKSKK